MEFRIIFSLQYSISINTFEVDSPSDSLHNAVVKPNNYIPDTPDAIRQRDAIFLFSLTDNFDPSLNFPNI